MKCNHRPHLGHHSVSFPVGNCQNGRRHLRQFAWFSDGRPSKCAGSNGIVDAGPSPGALCYISKTFNLFLHLSLISVEVIKRFHKVKKPDQILSSICLIRKILKKDRNLKEFGKVHIFLLKVYKNIYTFKSKHELLFVFFVIF